MSVAERQNAGRIAVARTAILTGTAIAMCAFQLYTAGTLPLTPSLQRGIHLAFALIIVFVSSRETDRGSPRGAWIDGLFILAALLAVGRILSFLGEIPPEVTAFMSTADSVLAVVMIVVVLEATRRLIGNALPIVTLVFLAYALLGGYLPGVFGHEGTTLTRMLSVEYFSAQGVFGIPLGASADLIFPLVLFGAFMIVMGSSEVFFEIAIRLTRRVRGGAALATVMASAAMGTVTGSGIANASSTGVFTIPLMKRVGYRPQMAAAIESAASSGAQIMPPVMGTSAFIMAELLNVSYGTIAIAALVPGCLYFFAILLQVYLEACRTGIGSFKQEDGPSLRVILKRGWHLLAGPLLLLYLIAVVDLSPGRSAFFSILMVVAVDLVAQLVHTRRVDGSRIVKAFVIGAMTGAGIAAATAFIGLIIGALDITGMTIRMGAAVALLAHGNALALLVLTMIFCLVLGAGLPTLLAYIVVAATVAPNLINAGFSPLPAHLFVFYFAMIADITPPVGVTSVVAARIADAPPMASALTATRLCLIAWMIPYYFIYNPGLLLIGPLSGIVVAIGLTLIATVLLATAVVGYCYGPLGMFTRLLVFACLAVYFVLPTSVAVNIGALSVAVVAIVADHRIRLKAIAGAGVPRA
jgi:TRAP transporter 4TM/12TM fusion protein